MIVPKKFKIFDIDHTVEESSEVTTENGNWGEYQYGTKKIKIYSGLENKAEVFYHEIAEAIATLLDMKIDGERLPHHIINGFGLGIYSFIKSNPHIFRGD